MLKLPGAYVASGSLVYFGIALRVIAIAYASGLAAAIRIIAGMPGG